MRTRIRRLSMVAGSAVVLALFAVPALVLAPAAIGSSPPDATSIILLVAAVWLALAMSFTSYILARAGRPAVAEHAARRRRRRIHAPLRFAPSARLHVHSERTQSWAARSR